MGIFSSYSTAINTGKSGQKFPSYLKLLKKSLVYSVAIKVKGKQVI